jgi:carbamoyl-phosphate synthase large subunit
LDELPDGPPWIIKPTQGGGSSAVFIAQDSHELRFFTDYLLEYNYTPLVQTYVGSVDHEYTVGILHSPNGELMGSMVIHRQILSGLSNRFRLPNRTGRSELGSALAVSSGISQGRIVNCPLVQARAEEIADTLGSIGPLNIQGRLVGEDFVPFEINPRFSGTTPMRALAGFNEPELLIRWHLQPDSLWRCRLRIKHGEFARGLAEYFTPSEDVDVDSNA